MNTISKKFISLAMMAILSAVNAQDTPITKYNHTVFKNDTINISDKVSSMTEVQVSFDVSLSDLENKSLRVITNSTSGLIVVVRHNSGIESWKHTDTSQEIIEQTIWLNRSNISTNENVAVSVTFSTFSQSDLELAAEVKLIENYIEIASSYAETVFPKASVVWVFNADQYNGTVTVLVISNDTKVCGVVSVHPIGYQYNSNDLTPEKDSIYQSMLGKSVIDIELKGKFAFGFFIIVQVSPDSYHDRKCFEKLEEVSDGRTKKVTINVHLKPDGQILLVSLVVIGGYFIACGLAITLTLCCFVPFEGKHVKKIKSMATRTGSQLNALRKSMATFYQIPSVRNHNDKQPDHMTNQSENNQEDDSVDGIHLSRPINGKRDEEELVVAALMCQVKTQVEQLMRKQIAKDVKNCQGRVIIHLYKEHIKESKNSCDERREGNKLLTLNDFATTCDKELYPGTLKMKSSLYLWIIWLMGIFYTLPVSQLLIQNQLQIQDNGNLDKCFYNFLCKYKVGPLEDFGHLFSNFAYVISGFFFVVICKIRRKRYREFHAQLAMKNPDMNQGMSRGIPEQFGIFYAMGGALAIEGVLSACYHICPTKVNFQFDTTFMYVIAVLVFLKVYQFRHPDITSNAYNVFFVIGIALSLEVTGYYVSNLWFYVLFVIFYLSVLVMFTIHTYYNGRFRGFTIAWSKMFQEARSGNYGNLRPASKRRFILCSLMVFINVLLGAYFLTARKPGISRYLLAILMANMLLYVGYYCIMKFLRFRGKKNERGPKKNEKISKTCLIYFVCGLICAFIGMYFFSKGLKDPSLSAAESRHLNGFCAVSIFDNHDIWHFASAAGLFFIFMMILTLEDNNLTTPWEEIEVF